MKFVKDSKDITEWRDVSLLYVNDGAHYTEPGIAQPAPLSGGDPPICGGSVNHYDADAPKTIKSEDVTFFEVESSFAAMANEHAYSYVYAYAATVDAGVLLALNCRCDAGFNTSKDKPDGSFSAVALADAGVLAELNRIAVKYDFASHNGRSHYVNGLPQNFGGHVLVNYVSGEYISYDDNQCSVIGTDAASEIVDTIKNYIGKKRLKSPNVRDIVAVTYSEDRGKNNYTYYRMDADTLVTEQQFGKADQIFKNKYDIPAESIQTLRKLAEDNALLSWTGLYEYDWDMYRDRTERIIFTMKDGSEIAVKESMRKPAPAGRVIFNMKMFMNDLEK